jgi:T6SS, Phospholipase effector Tle1-like, catalytic domain
VKNIVILSDGTGQGARMPKAERTNVWKLWDATKNADPAQQVTFYDEAPQVPPVPGVGAFLCRALGTPPGGRLLLPVRALFRALQHPKNV